MITELTADEVVDYCRSFLGLGSGSSDLDDILLVGLLRRAAGVFCPCSKAALRTTLLESLTHLHTGDNSLVSRCTNLIEDMIVSGDLLELPDVMIDDPDVRRTWVFAAPPAFIVRRSGSIFLIGIVPDQSSFLPKELEERVISSRMSRFIHPKPDENLVEKLEAHGLSRLNEEIWLKSPRTQTPKQLIDVYHRHLATQSPSGQVPDLRILDLSTNVTYYPGRWCLPKNHTGTYVARRPQEFGALLWSFVELIDGVPKQIFDLPLADYHWRGCDAAWHLQMALDHLAGQPQQYKRSVTDTGIRLDFYSPLPLWAERRLMIFGSKQSGSSSLFAYEIPISEAKEEEKRLQENLWLNPVSE